MDEEKQATIGDQLVALAESLGLEEGDLDADVHALKSMEANNLNNRGFDAQVEFLVEAQGEQQTQALIETLGST